MKTKKEKYKWKINKDLAVYANEMARTFSTDRDLEESILLENQVPQNIEKSLTIDSFASKLLETEKLDLAKDHQLARISKKITDIYAPLSRVWEVMEDYKNLQSDGHTLNVEKINTCLQQTVLLIDEIY